MPSLPLILFSLFPLSLIPYPIIPYGIRDYGIMGLDIPLSLSLYSSRPKAGRIKEGNKF